MQREDKLVENKHAKARRKKQIIIRKANVRFVVCKRARRKRRGEGRREERKRERARGNYLSGQIFPKPVNENTKYATLVLAMRYAPKNNLSSVERKKLTVKLLRYDKIGNITFVAKTI